MIGKLQVSCPALKYIIPLGFEAVDRQEADEKSVKSIESQVGCSKFLAKLLVLRGQTDPVLAQNFIHPKLKHLDDPFTIQNMDRAIERIISARKRKKSSVSWGL